MDSLGTAGCDGIGAEGAAEVAAGRLGGTPGRSNLASMRRRRTAEQAGVVSSVGAGRDRRLRSSWGSSATSGAAKTSADRVLYPADLSFAARSSGAEYCVKRASNTAGSSKRGRWAMAPGKEGLQ